MSETSLEKKITGIDLWYSTFKKRFAITLPFKETHSPVARPRTNPYKAVKYIHYLYFQDRSALEDAIERCSAPLQVIDSEHLKIDVLTEKLEDAFKASRERAASASTVRRSPYNINGIPFSAEPISPIHMHSLRRPSTAAGATRSLDRQIAVGGMMPPPPPLPASEGAQTRSKSAQTSFASMASSTASIFSANDGLLDGARDEGSDTDMDSVMQDADQQPSMSSFAPSSSTNAAMEELCNGDMPRDYRQREQHRQQEEEKSKAVPELSTAKLHRSECYRIRDIPIQSFPGTIDWPLWILSLPLHLRLECHRAHQAGLITSIQELGSEWPAPRTLTSLHKLIKTKKAAAVFQPGFESDFSNATLCAKLHWTRKKNGPIFRLEMLPPRKEPSNALQRKFGGRRFLYIDVPVLSEPPKIMELKGQEDFIRQRFFGLLRLELDILGCKWKYFHAQPRKSKTAKDPEFSMPGACRVIFFATSDRYSKMEEMSVMDVVDWALPLRENLHQTACKAGARIDLAASRTDEGIPFAPSEIAYNVDDALAIDVPDTSKHDDPKFSRRLFDGGFDPAHPEVMNDGCNSISHWAMLELRKKLGWSNVPAVVQARIGPAKGMWYRITNDHPSQQPGKSISISKSQKKLNPKANNFTESYDKNFWTLNVVKHSHRSSPSVLYMDYITILIDRGISAQTVVTFAERMVKREVDDFVSAVDNRQMISHWIHSRGLIKEGSGNQHTSNLPTYLRARAERAFYMLNADFESTECRFLANEILGLGELVFTPNKRNFKIPVPRSTMLLGIADPLGVLKPGEIHLAFSEAFEDEESGELLPNLHGRDVLVARNPALRNSDIQKVTTVYKHELGHLLDVVIFPSAARRPLAGKLQGGDYDGDTFWVCWQPEFVEGFKNAPAPWKLPAPETYGIKVSRTTLGEAIQPVGASEPQEEAVTEWLISQAQNRIKFDLLGKVTLMHGRVVYKENKITSERAKALTDLHDHLVDADKQGYEFDHKAWGEFMKKYGIDDSFREPAYRQYLNLKQNATVDRERLRKHYKKTNILDRIVFEVVDPIVKQGIKHAREVLGTSGIFDSLPKQSTDAALTMEYQSRKEETNSATVQQEVLALRAKIDSLARVRGKEMSKFYIADHGSADYNANVARCREAFEAILPDDSSKQPITEWIRPIGNGWTYWDLLKASAAANFCAASGSGKMIFEVLCAELCHLKALASGRSCILTLEAYVDLKPRAPRKIAAERPVEEESDDSDWEAVDEDEDGATEYGDVDWCDDFLTAT